MFTNAQQATAYRRLHTALYKRIQRRNEYTPQDPEYKGICWSINWLNLKIKQLLEQQ